VFGKITDEDQCCLENDEIRLMRTKNNAEINGIIAKKHLWQNNEIGPKN
jgi:hypothetical protein